MFQTEVVENKTYILYATTFSESGAVCVNGVKNYGSARQAKSDNIYDTCALHAG